MDRPVAHAANTSTLLRFGVSLTAAAALLAGCGGSQPPLSVSAQELSTQQTRVETTYNILHEFGVSAEDGKNPAADLINVRGILYGTTLTGGSHLYGTVFSITKSGQETVLHSFGARRDGINPMARLLNVNGTLYGTTALGGAKNGGTVFSITRDGTEKILYSFDSSNRIHRQPDGSNPVAGLINVNGTLYGTTIAGGSHKCDTDDYCGTVFSLTTDGQFKVVHNFGATDYDGENPEAALVNVKGTLYGTTYWGGNGDHGTVFSITTAGKYHLLYSFGTNQDDGGNPMSDLIDVQGTLYGTASGGGSGGAVFSLTADGTEKTIHNFGGRDGSGPLAGLIDVKGVLYGTTSIGGVYNDGTVFSVTTSGVERVLHSFHSASGDNPRASLLEVGGTLYGTTYGSINETHGTVFSLTP
jgi:uncharacterized repeat protein (TIGR03803 family)